MEQFKQALIARVEYHLEMKRSAITTCVSGGPRAWKNNSPVVEYHDTMSKAFQEALAILEPQL